MILPVRNYVPPTKKTIKRKPIVRMKFTNKPLDDFSMGFYSGVVMGTLHRLGRRVEAQAFYVACKPNKDKPVNISPVDFVREASKYVYFKLEA